MNYYFSLSGHNRKKIAHLDYYLCFMADVHTKEIRSKNMIAIRDKNTKPEMLVRKFLHANGFRYRLYDKKLPGKPDIVLPKYKTVTLKRNSDLKATNFSDYLS